MSTGKVVLVISELNEEAAATILLLLLEGIEPLVRMGDRPRYGEQIVPKNPPERGVIPGRYQEKHRQRPR